MEIIDRVWENRNNGGCCCSENMMTLALEDMGWTKEAGTPLIKAMGAYCGGLHEGLACGTLCGGKAVLFLAEDDYTKAREELGPELMRWFKEKYGSWNCADILEGDMDRKQTLCPIIVAETYTKLYEMLKEIGAV